MREPQPSLKGVDMRVPGGASTPSKRPAGLLGLADAGAHSDLRRPHIAGEAYDDKLLRL
jgi:hypothetical protein